MSTSDPSMPTPAGMCPVGVDRAVPAVRQLARLGGALRCAGGFVVDGSTDVAELIRQSRNIGYDQVLGVLAGGVDGWACVGHDLETTPIAGVDEAAGPVLDVRQRAEYDAGHIPDADHIELGNLVHGDHPPTPVSLMCGHGERAMTAASLLARSGKRDVTVLVGGPEDWARRHGPLETDG